MFIPPTHISMSSPFTALAYAWRTTRGDIDLDPLLARQPELLCLPSAVSIQASSYSPLMAHSAVLLSSNALVRDFVQDCEASCSSLSASKPIDIRDSFSKTV